jgi:hypothetical protein
MLKNEKREWMRETEMRVKSEGKIWKNKKEKEI